MPLRIGAVMVGMAGYGQPHRLPPGKHPANRSPRLYRRHMDFRVLGPLEASDEGRTLPLGPRRQRAVLARLLLDAGRTIPVERLLDDVWGEALPDTAVKMIHIYVSGLRKALGASRIVTQPP